MACEICHDNGYVPAEGTYGPVAVACTCRARGLRTRRLARRPRSAMLPRRYRDVAADDQAITAMRDRARTRVLSYAGDIQRRAADGKGLWLYGPAEFDKSPAAALLAKAALDAGQLVTFTSPLELLAGFKDRRPIDDPARPDSAGLVAAPDLLVLRNLDSAPDEDWALPRLAGELRRRCEREVCATVITSERSPSELGELWGWRTISALKRVTGPAVNVDPEYEPPLPDPVAIRISRARKREERAAAIRNGMA